MARVFVCGEALIDFVPRQVEGGDGFLALPGGSPFNITKAAALAGSEAHFLGALSNDLFGDRLLADLHANGVQTDLTPRSADPTTLAFVDMSAGDPRYAFFDRDSASVNMAPTDAGMNAAAGDILCVGSISLIPRPGADNITDFAVAQAERLMLATDPNVRANMIHDRAPWEARLDAIFAAATIVKISDEDLAFLRPGVSAAGFAEQMKGHGVALVVVTGGAEGAQAFTAAGTATGTAPRVKIADTVGAGDTFMGNLLAGVQRMGCTDRASVAALGPDALADLLQVSSWAAAINCTRQGCHPPRLAETQKALAAGQVTAG